MHETTLVELEKLFLALSDRTRLRLLSLMADGEVPVGFLADKLGESQPKISRHLAYLRSAGLVSTRREGKWVYYGIEGQDAVITSVLNATLNSLSPVGNGRHEPSGIDQEGNRSPSREIATETYSDDWRPTELEIHLL